MIEQNRNKKHVLAIKNTTENQKYILSVTKRLDLKRKENRNHLHLRLISKLNGNILQCNVQ